MFLSLRLRQAWRRLAFGGAIFGATFMVLGGVGLLTLLPACVSTSLAAELTPESPEVLQAVKRATTYLEGADDVRIGGKALIALALIKTGTPVEDPKVQKKVQEAVEAIRDELNAEAGFRADIYSTGLAIVFLAALDGKTYRAEIEGVLKSLYARQKPHGGWGYPNRSTGDTSMTQYAVLSLWEASRAGIRVPANVWSGVIRWLLQTQDPSGAFAYQGHPSERQERIPQQDIRLSMTVAGTGSLYIARNYLRGARSLAKRSSAVPPQFKPVRKRSEKSAARRPKVAINPEWLEAALYDGDAWLRAHFTVRPNVYAYYYSYTLERYEAFKEFAGGGPPIEPAWYTKMATDLLKRQHKKGYWPASMPIGPPVATSFAVLFLTRSTQRGLGPKGFGEGTLVGGRGLPSDVSKVELKGGRVTARALEGPAEELFRLLDHPQGTETASALESIRQRTARGDPDVEQSAERFRKLAASETPDVRAAVLAALARSRNLDDVTLLIRALNDPDPRVVVAARDGLRFISRKFDGFGLPDHPTATERQRAVKQWTAWYHTIRPEFELTQPN